ncbi:hypothetical protein [Xanthobacter tagetidis]|uniref:Uncharacterized protein n=1 Tax=Xanthobacter tagetidis TaxID=60216 RepID=A0A3L7AGL7_9HYPH|nr:hypothetical protein [Xanthobacter tagetidis]MBB6306253.1 hypothetical protein [Xanthobacter tagetidis]RLP79529.1 hypothetical protein D9R14_07655 [Xanthobacter tagetidis]
MNRFASALIPNLLDGAVMVFGLGLAAAIGRAELDAWWLLIPGFLVGYAYDAGRRRAAAERDAHQAEALFAALRDGSDVTWNVVHFDPPTKGDTA